jgi:predicted Zn-dependent peptidase
MEGIQVIYERVSHLNITGCCVFLPVGSLAESIPGLTNLTLKTAFKGIAGEKSSAFSRKIEPFSSNFIVDVFQEFSIIRFQAVTEKFCEVFEILGEIFRNPGFSEENFIPEKETILASIRAENENPVYCALREIMKITYGNSPYSIPPVGTLESVSKISLEDCVKRFEFLAIPKGTFVAVAGNADEEKVCEIAQNILPLKELSAFHSVPEPLGETKVIERKRSPQGVVIVGFEAPGILDHQYPYYKLFDVFLGQGIGSVLFQELREKLGLAYSVGSFYPLKLNKGRIYAFILTSVEKVNIAFTELMKVLENLPDFVNSSTFNRALGYLKGTLKAETELRWKKAWFAILKELTGVKKRFDRHVLEILENVELNDLLLVCEKVASSKKDSVLVL